MPKRIRIHLSEADRTQLERWAKSPPRSYLRYRAQAILEIADGKPVYQIAKQLKLRVHRTTVSIWAQRYLAEGVSGLRVKPGRGRKAGFSPSGGATSQGSD